MIEVHLDNRNTTWDVNATILPYGGLGIAKQATLATISAPSFIEAANAVASLDTASFVENRDRWPVPGPKFQITNCMSHPDHERFGNYRIEMGGAVIGTIENFPRGNNVELIKEALSIVASADSNSARPDASNVNK
jgi:hypothetical protein